MTSADYMTRTYRWMALGTADHLCGGVCNRHHPAVLCGQFAVPAVHHCRAGAGDRAERRVQNMSVGAARGVFLGYALLNGMVLSYYFLAFDLGTLVLAFLATSLYFG